MSDDIAIKVNEVYKDFKLPHQKINSIKSIFTSLYKKRAKSFETQHALKNISFEIKKGEFFGIVGRNGSGKSTLLKIIAEIYQPTKGSLQKSGKLVPFIELGVGFNPELTGRENVYLNGALLGFSEKEIDEQYEDIVQFAELEPFMDQKLKNYSSGMQVRLAFSVATRAKADILLIDEVLAVGDADFQRKCFNYFKSLKKSDTTVIFVSHDMDAVREYCDRAVLIDSSEIVQAGLPDRIAQHYTKLFMAQENSSSSASSANSVIRDVVADVSAEHVEIKGVLRFRRKMDGYILGFFVKNSAGVSVLGSNSKLLRRKLGAVIEGQEVDFIWRFPNILSDGGYTATIALLNEDGVTAVEWQNDIVRFTIKKPTITPYPVMPEMQLIIDSKESSSAE